MKADKILAKLKKWLEGAKKHALKQRVICLAEGMDNAAINYRGQSQAFKEVLRKLKERS